MYLCNETHLIWRRKESICQIHRWMLIIIMRQLYEWRNQGSRRVSGSGVSLTRVTFWFLFTLVITNKLTKYENVCIKCPLMSNYIFRQVSRKKKKETFHWHGLLYNVYQYVRVCLYILRHSYGWFFFIAKFYLWIFSFF